MSIDQFLNSNAVSSVAQLHENIIAVMIVLFQMAEVYWQLHKQHSSTWTQEIDLRPSVETF